MSKYKQTNMTGSSYVRANQITIYNQLDRSPSIVFTEEQILNIDQEEIHRAISNCQETLTVENALESFALLNSETGEPLGANATYADFATMLYSLYFYVAGKRDILESAQSNEAE